MFSKCIAPIVIVLGLLTMSAGQDPLPTPTPSVQAAKVVIEGPVKAKVGELIILDASKSTAQDFEWVVLPSTKNYVVIDGEKRLIFSSPVAGVYTIFVSVAYEGTVASHVYTVTIAGPATDLSSKVASWVESLPVSETRDAEADRLAGSFETIASLIDAGSFAAPKDVLVATKQANQDALGAAKDVWTPFFVSLQAELAQMSSNGRLTEPASYAPAWREIAAGLRAR